jgi:hypothetical protein
MLTNKLHKMSPAQRNVLANLVGGRRWDAHLSGRSAYLFNAIGSGPLNVSFRIGGEDPQFDQFFAQLKDSTSIHAVVNNTNMRFDAAGLRPNFDVYTPRLKLRKIRTSEVRQARGQCQPDN